ncbi:hypothetical protein [Kribbia dieselivorans]|uniref:hypothetical protein n=1 Tax=Kribbia dieselivorans TaxID=331526 RepID=UPI0008384A72|nr:hypothetical protein [Kribbia dieselivorans]
MDVLHLLGDILQVARGAMGLDSEVISRVDSGGREFVVALGVALLAGISSVLGRWAVLAINGVRGGRLVLSIVVASLVPFILYTLTAVAVWGTATVVLGDAPSLGRVVPVVLLATAPHIWGFLVLVPYLGPGIERILSVWGALVLWTGVAVVLDVDRWTALGISVAAWAITRVGAWLMARPLQWVRDTIWRLATGTPMQLTVQDVLDAFPMPEPDPQEGQR